MIIGGFNMIDRGFAIEVSEFEAGWSFLLQGDDAYEFRNQWQLADSLGSSFGTFLRDHEYYQLFE